MIVVEPRAPSKHRIDSHRRLAGAKYAVTKILEPTVRAFERIHQAVRPVTLAHGGGLRAVHREGTSHRHRSVKGARQTGHTPADDTGSLALRNPIYCIACS